MNIKTIEACPVDLNESLATSRHCKGVSVATVHLACVTVRQPKEQLLLMSVKGGSWQLPHRTFNMAGTLMSFPNEIIKTVMRADVEYLRGSRVAWSDTRLIGQFVDEASHLHFFIRVNISHMYRQNWRYITSEEQLAPLGECDEMVLMTMRQLKLKAGVEKDLMAA